MLTKYEIEESELNEVIYYEFIDRRTLEEATYLSPGVSRVVARATDGAYVAVRTRTNRNNF